MNNYHLMCRLTCSRCWRALIWLSYCQVNARPWPEMVVLAPGDGRYLGEGQRLAEAMGLPVRFALLAKPVRETLHSVKN